MELDGTARQAGSILVREGFKNKKKALRKFSEAAQVKYLTNDNVKFDICNLYVCTQNQFNVQMFMKPVNCTLIHKL